MSNICEKEHVLSEIALPTICYSVLPKKNVEFFTNNRSIVSKTEPIDTQQIGTIYY